MRQIILDTETTGIEVKDGHRIIEVGAVELTNRRLTGHHFHEYLMPDRDIDAGAQEVHGISAEFLADKPRFESIAGALFEYLDGAELIAHNAGFDVGFLNAEFGRLPAAEFPEIAARLGRSGRRVRGDIARVCEITDSLVLARRKHPGQRNSLDALCRRYEVDNSSRQLHGALLDAEILADVYLRMTGGQTALFSGTEADAEEVVRLDSWQPPRNLVSIRPTAEEQSAHETYLDLLDSRSEGAVWRRSVAAEQAGEGDAQPTGTR
ncbi:MAG: DNA polymerase III subunit epsilon [Pseudomonadota bacterium]